MIASINDLDGTGFVFRVDMRLRPFGDSGPLVVSSAMLEEYLYSEGRDWERFAWLKGRVVNRAVFMEAADFSQAVKNLESLVRPFVFRKYVDFSAISALAHPRDDPRRDDAPRGRPRQGRQHQVGQRRHSRNRIHLPDLSDHPRRARTHAARAHHGADVAELARLGSLTPENARRLTEDYYFLRNLEHALQYVDDKQTQTMPVDPTALVDLAAMVGYTTNALMRKLSAIRAYVGQTFDSIFHTEKPRDDDGWPTGWRSGDESVTAALTESLGTAGFTQASRLRSASSR